MINKTKHAFSVYRDEQCNICVCSNSPASFMKDNSFNINKAILVKYFETDENPQKVIFGTYKNYKQLYNLRLN